MVFSPLFFFAPSLPLSHFLFVAAPLVVDKWPGQSKLFIIVITELPPALGMTTNAAPWNGHGVRWAISIKHTGRRLVD